MAYHVSSHAALVRALDEVGPGEAVELEPGNYERLNRTGQNFGGVTVRSADPTAPARFSGVYLGGCSGLALSRIHIEGDDKYLVHFDGGRGLAIQDSTIRGGSKISIAAWGVSGLDITGNDLDDSGGDGMRLAGVSDFMVVNNLHRGTFHPRENEHMDFAQMTKGCRKGTFRGNVFLCKSHVNVQGIFGGDDVPHVDILMEENLIATGMHNGMYVNSVSTGITRRRNTLVNIDGGETVLVGPAADSDNIICGLGDFSLYYQGRPGLGMTIEDFRPKPGDGERIGPGDGERIGAIARIRELLGTVEPVSTPPEPESEPVPSEPEPEAAHGIASVEITIHHVPVGGLPAALAALKNAGFVVDVE